MGMEKQLVRHMSEASDTDPQIKRRRLEEEPMKRTPDQAPSATEEATSLMDSAHNRATELEVRLTNAATSQELAAAEKELQDLGEKVKAAAGHLESDVAEVRDFVSSEGTSDQASCKDAAFVAVLCRLGAARLCLAELVAKKAAAEEVLRQEEGEAQSLMLKTSSVAESLRSEQHRIKALSAKMAELANTRRAEEEEKARREAEEKARREAEERAWKEAEEKARTEAEERAQREAEEKARRDAEERTRKEAEEEARKEAEERVMRQAEEKMLQEAEERTRKEADEKLRQEAEERARKEAQANEDLNKQADPNPSAQLSKPEPDSKSELHTRAAGAAEPPRPVRLAKPVPRKLAIQAESAASATGEYLLMESKHHGRQAYKKVDAGICLVWTPREAGRWILTADMTGDSVIARSLQVANSMDPTDLMSRSWTTAAWGSRGTLSPVRITEAI